MLEVSSLVVDALQLALWLSLPVLGACGAVALVTSFVQSSLAVQDPSLGFVPKWFAGLAALWLSRDFVQERLLGFTSRILRVMAELGH
ncbi:MAG: Bacterial export protein family 3 [Pseudomonadota bacterium]